ncbi:MAG: helix-turn-helix domain-containing protein [Pseudomonadota bacterium]
MTGKKGHVVRHKNADEQNTPTAINLHRVTAVLYPGVVALDLVGPIEAFNYATMILAETAPSRGYKIDIVGVNHGPVETISPIKFFTETAIADYERSSDILLVPGMRTGDVRYRDEKLMRWLPVQAERSRRLVSICSGVFLLAEAGLLANAEVTTHWMDSPDLREAFPNLKINDDEIYCRSGKIYTSGGVTAGIDLALAIIAEDYGNALALKVARRMIVYLKRAGNQTQFSGVLHAQSKASRFADLLDWIESNLHSSLTIAQLSEKCAMSPRNFSRSFTNEIGVTPIGYVTRRRLDQVRTLLVETKLTIKSIAVQTGFSSAASMTRAFNEAFKITPTEYRDRFC